MSEPRSGSCRQRVLDALPGCVEVIMRNSGLTYDEVNNALSWAKRKGLARPGLVTPSGRYWRAVPQ